MKIVLIILLYKSMSTKLKVELRPTSGTMKLIEKKEYKKMPQLEITEEAILVIRPTIIIQEFYIQ